MASFFTFTVTNAVFLTDKISLFGLTFSLKQSDLIALGRFSTLVILLVFLLHAVSGLTKLWVNRAKRLFELQQKELDEEMSAVRIEVYGEGGHGPEQEPESWEVYYERTHQKLARSRDRVVSIEVNYSSIKTLLLEYILVLVVALTAFFCPRIGALIPSSFAL